MTNQPNPLTPSDAAFYETFGTSNRYHDLTVPQFKDFLSGIYKHPTLAADFKIWTRALAHAEFETANRLAEFAEVVENALLSEFQGSHIAFVASRAIRDALKKAGPWNTRATLPQIDPELRAEAKVIMEVLVKSRTLKARYAGEIIRSLLAATAAQPQDEN